MWWIGWTNWEESVKAQEQDVNWKPLQNYRANHDEPVKTQKKEESYSQHKQSYRAAHDDSIKAVNLLKR